MSLERTIPHMTAPEGRAPRRHESSLVECSPGRRRSLIVLRTFALLLLSGLLAGCNAVVLFPSGFVALEQRNLIVASTVLMLVIVVPVIALTLIFAWHFREEYTAAA